MLVLTRRQGEVIQIGENIQLRVVALGRHHVKLAIDAPREVPIHREEVCHRIAFLNERVPQVVDLEPLAEIGQQTPAAEHGSQAVGL